MLTHGSLRTHQHACTDRRDMHRCAQLQAHMHVSVRVQVGPDTHRSFKCSLSWVLPDTPRPTQEGWGGGGQQVEHAVSRPHPQACSSPLAPA